MGAFMPGNWIHCEQAFANAPTDAARIVVAHHHFAPAPTTFTIGRCQKSRRAMMRFVELGVDMILGGHLHRAYIGNSLDFYPGQHRERGIIIVPVGDDKRRGGDAGREQEKNSLNVVQIYRRSIDITHCLLFRCGARICLDQQAFVSASGKAEKPMICRQWHDRVGMPATIFFQCEVFPESRPTRASH